MTDKNVKKTKEDFGYIEELKDFYFQTNTSSQKGSFHVQKRKKDYYWYFLLSSGDGKKRFKYLCKTFEGVNSNGETSFQHCLKVLSQKQLEDFKPKVMSNMKIGRLIDEYIGELLKEEQSNNGRMYETTTSLKNSVNRFDDFCKITDVRFDDLKNGSKLKTLILNYISHCEKKHLTRNTIKTYIKGVRQFLNWLSDEDVGKGLLQSHPITMEWVNKIYKPSRKDKKHVTDQLGYDKEHYDQMLNICGHKVGDLWNDYLKNGDQKKTRFHTKGVGSDIVYFISLFQLYSGFRFGEILMSFRSKDHWLKRKDVKNSSTYWDKRDGVWFLILDDFKGRDGLVPIQYKVKSWVKPPCDHKVVKDKNGKIISYDTDLVDVCKLMFRESQYMFSSPNMVTHKNRHISRTHYSQIFKSIIVEKENFKKFDVEVSHHLRSYFISHMISEGYDIMDLCEITRHSVQTMMKFYKRLSEKTQIKRQSKMDKSRSIVKRQIIRNQDK